jgi:hypothetical protein
MKTQMRNIVAFIVAILVLSSACCSQLKSATQEKLVFRAPFTLKLRIDNDHYYEENFDKDPYVADDAVYIFVGEAFGINVTINGNQLSRDLLPSTRTRLSMISYLRIPFLFMRNDIHVRRAIVQPEIRKNQISLAVVIEVGGGN